MGHFCDYVPADMFTHTRVNTHTHTPALLDIGPITFLVTEFPILVSTRPRIIEDLRQFIRSLALILKKIK